jgi:vesicle-associated membrane protein 7
MDYFNSPEADKLLLLKKSVEETKEIMLENLDKLLDRGQKIDLIVQKTTAMVKYDMLNN